MKNKRRIHSTVIINLIIGLLLFGCSENDGGGGHVSQDLANVMSKSEIAEWMYFDISPQNQIKKEGKYSNGLKNGKWSYYLNNNGNFNIDWTALLSDTVALNYPSDWSISKEGKRLFLAMTKTGGYFVILEHENLNLTPIDYLSGMYSASLKDEKEQLVTSKAKLLKFKNRDIIAYEFIYSSDKGDEEAIGVIVPFENRLYDIVYRSVDNNNAKNQNYDKVLFADIINTMSLYGKPVIPYIIDLKDVSHIPFE